MASKKKSKTVVQAVDESIPATIVEGSEEQVFATPVEGTETTVVGDAPAPEVKKERINRRPYIALCQEHLEIGDLDRKELIKLVMDTFSEVRLGGIQTFVTDLRNVKYNHFKERAVILNAKGKLQFEDKIVPVEAVPVEVVPEEAQTMEEPTEQAGE